MHALIQVNGLRTSRLAWAGVDCDHVAAREST